MTPHRRDDPRRCGGAMHAVHPARRYALTRGSRCREEYAVMREVDTCKVCGGEAPFFDVVDAAKSCGEPMGRVLPRTGTEVVFSRCVGCGLMFTRWADAFTDEDFRREIYNERYVEVDPLYPSIRPRASAAMLGEVFSRAWRLDAPRVLDYGAGSGSLAARLGPGVRTTSWDPFSLRHEAPPEGGFDLVFACEVLEHSTDPLGTLRGLGGFVRPGGLVLFSTTVQPPDIATRRAGWWYASPRNGHVTLFTREALRRGCDAAGLAYASLSDEWHLAERRDAPCAAINRAALQDVVDEMPSGYVEV